jgi:hypothetical protein
MQTQTKTVPNIFVEVALTALVEDDNYEGRKEENRTRVLSFFSARLGTVGYNAQQIALGKEAK